MKQQFCIFALLFILLPYGANAQKQKTFQGTISYTMQTEYGDKNISSYATCYYSNKYNKISADIYGINLQLIQDLALDSTTLLINAMGNKIAVPLPIHQADDSAGINLGDMLSTDTICNYNCQKYLVFHGALSDTDINNMPSNTLSNGILQNAEVNIWVYLSKDICIRNILSGTLPLPKDEAILQIEMEQTDIRVKITATDIKPCKLSDKEFQIDKSYKYITLALLQEYLKWLR